MKKAKEYAQQILDANNEKIDVVILAAANEMILEIQEIAEQRKIRTNSALKAIIQQQNQKWKAICKNVNRDNFLLKETGFLELLKAKIPETRHLL